MPAAPIKTASSTTWPSAIVFVHWLTVLLVLAVFGLAIAHEWVDEQATRQALLQWHRGLGLSAFALVLLRLSLRLLGAAPDHGLGALGRWLAHIGHGALYLALFGLPTLGYLLTSARTGRVDWFGLSLPALIGRDRDLAESIEGWHGTLGWVMLALIGLHAAMALWHHHGRQDNVLRSMWPARRRTP